VTFFESSKVLELSQKEDDAFDLLDKTRFIINHHPDWLRLKLDPDQSGLIGLPATGGIVRALPSTQNAGRSTDATLVICDEWEYHPYAEVNFAAVKPTVDAGGQIVGVSTVDKLNQSSFPKYIWHNAVDGNNNFMPLFFGWNVVPSRDKEWFARVTKDMQPWMREQEYPLDAAEALSAVSSKCFFDQDSLNEMKLDVPKPIETRYNGQVVIYKKYMAGKKYVYVIDSADGTDPSAGIITDWQTGDLVAKFHGKMSVDDQAVMGYRLYEEYGEPFTAVERNADGRRLIDKLKALGITNWYYDQKDKKLEKPGWWTNDTNRPYMLGELSEAIIKRQIRLDKDCIDEFLCFIRNENNRAEAMTGKHDDYVVAWAIMWQVRKSMPIPAGKVKSYRYREVIV
jgi:hypothetical protein